MASPILERLLGGSDGGLTVDYARQVLAVEFSQTEQDRAAELSEKAQLGTLTPDERGELEELVAANDLLTILHAKAQLSLRGSTGSRP